MSRPLNLDETAAALGRYRYVELALFERLGARSQSARADVALYLAGSARAHAHRAALFEARLPVSVGLPAAETLTVSPGQVLDGAVDALVTQGDDALCCGLVEVLYPAMIAGYRDHVDACSFAADQGVRRCLRRAVADLQDVAAEGEGLAMATGEMLGSATLQGALHELGGPFGPLRTSP